VGEYTLAITGDKYTLRVGGQTSEGTFTLDRDRHEIDLRCAKGPDAGRTFKGIYALTIADKTGFGPMLRLALGAPDGARPEEFGSANMEFTFKRPDSFAPAVNPGPVKD
jgi:uncharacterized protein (TIGR03067 family)